MNLGLQQEFAEIFASCLRLRKNQMRFLEPLLANLDYERPILCFGSLSDTENFGIATFQIRRFWLRPWIQCSWQMSKLTAMNIDSATMTTSSKSDAQIDYGFNLDDFTSYLHYDMGSYKFELHSASFARYIHQKEFDITGKTISITYSDKARGLLNLRQRLHKELLGVSLVNDFTNDHFIIWSRLKQGKR